MDDMPISSPILDDGGTDKTITIPLHERLTDEKIERYKQEGWEIISGPTDLATVMNDTGESDGGHTEYILRKV